jgi:type IX secretion system PorP/SprF family membrane protein
MKKIYLSLILFWILFTPAVHAQIQSHFSFYNLQQSIINPAAMSTYDALSGAFVYNAQLVGYDGAPMTGLFDLAVPIGKTNATVGGQVVCEKIGANYRNMIAGNFSYMVPINLRNYLSFGISVMAEINRTDYTSLQNIDPNDPVLAGQSQTYALPNFKLGAYYFRDNFYAGVAIGNLISTRMDGANPRITSSASDLHFYVNAGYQLSFAKIWMFQPSVLLKQVSGAPLQIDLNAQFKFRNALGFGVSYRTLSTIVAQVNYNIKDKVLIGYAYNYGIGNMARTNFMGHEVILTFRAPKTNKKRISVDVPRF